MSAAASVVPGPQPPRHRNPPPRGWCTNFKDSPIPKEIGEYAPVSYAILDGLAAVLSAVEYRIFTYIYRWTLGDWQAYRPEWRVFIIEDLARYARCTPTGARKALERLLSKIYGAPVIQENKSGIGGKGRFTEYRVLLGNLALVTPLPVKTFARHAPPSGAAAKWAVRGNPAEVGWNDVPEEAPAPEIRASVAGPDQAAALRRVPAAEPFMVLPGRDGAIPLSEACPHAFDGRCGLIHGFSENKRFAEISRTEVHNSSPWEPFLLMPGAGQRPVPLSAAVRHVSYRNALPILVEATHFVKGDVLEIHLASPADDRTGQVDLTEIRQALMQVRRFPAGPMLSGKLKSVPTGSIIDETWRNLLGAPIPDLLDRIRDRWEVITSWALIPKLAEDVGAAWQAGEAERRKARAAAEREDAGALQRQHELEREIARETAAKHRFGLLPEDEKQRRRAAKDRELRNADPARYRRMSAGARAEEIHAMLIRDIAKEVSP